MVRFEQADSHIAALLAAILSGGRKKMSGWAYGIAWSSDIETGNDTIDSQHKQLFKLTSDIIEACESEKDRMEVGKILNFLASYTVKHFTEEEALQLEHKFPDYERHRKLHENFKFKIVELIHQYQTDSTSIDLCAQINHTVIRWLLQHIKGEDTKIAEHIRKKAGGK